jgi:hypothetical protein
MDIASIIALSSKFEKLAQSNNDRQIKLSETTTNKMDEFVEFISPILTCSGPDAQTYFSDAIANNLRHWPLRTGERIPSQIVSQLSLVNSAISNFSNRGAMSSNQWNTIIAWYSQYITNSYGKYLQSSYSAAATRGMTQIARLFLQDAKAK